MDRSFYRLLDLLVRQPSVVSAEIPFFRFLERLLRARGVRVKAYEGLLVAEGKDPDSMMISAHVDRHGLVRTGENEFQYAAYIATYKGFNSGDSISEQTFLSISERFHDEAVFAYDPWHGRVLGRGRIRSAKLCDRRNDMLFEIEGLEKLFPGTPVAYLDKVEWKGKHRLNAQLDNVLSVAMLVHLFEKGYQGRAFFTAQEETGRSWRFLYEWFQREGRDSETLLVLDTSPYPDEESAMGQALVLRRGDARANYDPETVEVVRGACEETGVSYRFKDDWVAEQNLARAAAGKKALSLGRTELGRMVEGTENRVSGATIQVPTLGYHTAAEQVSTESVEGLFKVLTKLHTSGVMKTVQRAS